MPTLFTRIGRLYGTYETPPGILAGKAMAEVPHIGNAWLLVENGRITGFGTMDSVPDRADTMNDLEGRSILPAFCDSHTHLVFAASREQEFVDRIRGLSYEEIALRGGGILNSASRLRDTPEEVLYEQAWGRLQEVMRQGTGAIEVKSGYGLDTASELKMLRIIRRLKESAPIPVKATFLGAHAVPEEFKGDREGYVGHLINEMLPRVAGEGLADYIDVFCERNYFTVADTERILEAGAKFGLKGKVHVNQFSSMGGIEACVRAGALSVDHLEVLEQNDLEALKGGNTIPVALPGCSFFIGLPYTPGREIIDAGLPLAIATDYNPGSTPAGDMRFMWSLACIQMKLLPEEAFNALTLNGAFAMEAADEVGCIAPGNRANFLVTQAPSLAYIPYAYTSGQWESLWLNGEMYHSTA
jgi:imidazolonepropionase